MDWPLMVSGILALAMTAAFAGIGFNRPTWSRSFTTAARYRFALASLVATYAVLMWVVYVALRRLSALNGSPISEVDAVWAALLLTTCVRMLPWISIPIRKFLHRMAGIPDTAHRVASMLADAKFIGDPAREQEARATLLTLAIDTSNDWLPPVKPVHRLMHASTLLFLRLRSWQGDDRFIEFFSEARNDFDRLRQRFDRLSLRVSRTLSTIERFGQLKQFASCAGPSTSVQGNVPPQFDDLLRRIVGDMASDICEDIAAFHRDACLLAARGILATESSYKRRNLAFRRMGFVLEERKRVMHYGLALLCSGLLLYVGCWIFFLLIPIANENIKLPALALLITLNVTAALAIAVIPKIHWGFANSGLRNRTPVGFVIGAGVCAVAFAVLSNLAMGVVLYGAEYGPWAGALKRLEEGSIYLPSTFATAATIAWLVQDHRWSTFILARRRRLCDALVLGSVWVVTSFIARVLMSVSWVADRLLHDTPEPVLQPLTLFNLVGAFIFGCALGALLPEAVRLQAPRRKLAEPVELTPELAEEVPSIAPRINVAGAMEQYST